MSQAHIFLIYVLVVFYALCYQLQAPLEPFLVERLVGKGKDTDVAMSYARLQMFFNCAQTVGSLSFGYLLDRAGARVGFVVNFLACALTYGILAQTSSISMLYLSKFPGVAMAGFLCAQTAVSQLTPPGPERVKALGRLTTSYTIGGVIGPYTGGLLGATGDYVVGAKVAMVGSLVAAGCSCLLPSKTDANAKRDEGKHKDETTTSEQIPWLVRARIVLSTVGFLILVKLITSTANSMASASQSLVLKNELGFSEADLGLFMSCQFGFGGFANGFLLAPLTVALGGEARKVVTKCVTFMAVGYAALAGINAEAVGLFPSGASASRTYAFIGMAMMLSVFQYSLGTSITAESTQLVPEDMKGSLIGMEHSIFSLARIFTPAIGVSILSSGGVVALYSTCSSIFLSVLGLWTIFSSRLLPAGAPRKKE